MRNNRLFKLTVVFLSVLAIAGVLSLAACAPEPASTPDPSPASTPTSAPEPEVITLKFSDPMPPTNTHNVLRTWWVEQVKERTNGRLEIEVFTGGALGSSTEQLNLVKNGTVDGALLVPAYFQNEMPAGNIVFLPFMAKGTDVQIKAFRELYNTNDTLRKEFEENNNMKLVSYSVPCDQVGGASTDIKSLNDLKGKKLRAVGSFLSIVKGVGGTPVPMGMPEIYDAIDKKTIDGFMSLPYDMVGPNHLNEVCPSLFYWHCNAPGGSFDVINMDTWNKLPTDIQDILVQLDADTDDYAYENSVNNEKKWVGILKDTPVYDFSQSDVDAIKANCLPGIYDDWVATAKEKGIDGAQELFDQYKALIDKYNAQTTYTPAFVK